MELQPNQFRSLKPEQQQAIESMAASVGIKETLQQQAESVQRTADKRAADAAADPSNTKAANAVSTYTNKANRLAEAAKNAPDTMSLDRAAANRVAQVEAGATTHRLPGESLGGGGWYYGASRDLFGGIPEEHHQRLNTGSSKLSEGSDPESEHRAARGLLASQTGTVHMNRKVRGMLGKAGVEVKPEHVDQHVPLSELHGDAVAALVSGRAKLSAGDHSGLHLDDMAATPKAQNLSAAHEVLRGAAPATIDPLRSPKFDAYAKGKESAHKGGSEQEFDFMSIQHDLGTKIRQSRMTDEDFERTGEVRLHPAQMPLMHDPDDLSGLRSPTHPTAEDTWMNAISHGHEDPRVFKAMGNVMVPNRIKHEGVQVAPSGSQNQAAYAFNNEATIRAGEELERKYLTGPDGALAYKVPSVLTQETSWTAARRQATTMSGRSQATEWTGEVARRKAVAAAEAKAAKGNRHVSKPQHEQLSLF